MQMIQALMGNLLVVPVSGKQKHVILLNLRIKTCNKLNIDRRTDDPRPFRNSEQYTAYPLT